MAPAFLLLFGVTLASPAPAHADPPGQRDWMHESVVDRATQEHEAWSFVVGGFGVAQTVSLLSAAGRAPLAPYASLTVLGLSAPGVAAWLTLTAIRRDLASGRAARLVKRRLTNWAVASGIAGLVLAATGTALVAVGLQWNDGPDLLALSIPVWSSSAALVGSSLCAATWVVRLGPVVIGAQ